MWTPAALLACLALSSAAAAPTAFDSVSAAGSRRGGLRIAFGSCHKTKFQHADVWRSVAALEPDLFLWTGDAVYTSSADRQRFGSVGALERAFQKMTAPASPYAQFLSSAAGPAFVEGTWDDHDMGFNDGGKHVPKRDVRQRLFLDFLRVPAESPRRVSRKGLYSAHRYVASSSSSPSSNNNNPSVSVIFLDTRFHRDNHIVQSTGGVSWLPFGAVIAAFTRALTSGMDHAGDVLGEEQWAWLDAVLQESASVSDLTIVVSSIQIFTSNPMVESWNHFPHARQRLIELIGKHKPRGLQFLSGDVHYAELAALPGGQVVEITSSGLTHSCTSPFWGGVCPDILSLFGSHRDHVRGRSSYTGRNFGSVDVDWQQGTATMSIHDVVTGRRVAGFNRSLEKDSELDTAALQRWAHRSRAHGTQVAGTCLAFVLMGCLFAVAAVLTWCGCRRCSWAPKKKSWREKVQ